MKTLNFYEFKKLATKEQLKTVKAQINSIIHYARTDEISDVYDADIICKMKNGKIVDIIDILHPDKITAENDFSTTATVCVKNCQVTITDTQDTSETVKQAVQFFNDHGFSYTADPRERYDLLALAAQKDGVYNVTFSGTLRQYANGRVELWEADIKFNN